MSAFVKKGKRKCWKVLLTRESFVTAFKDISSHWDLSDDLTVAFEKCVCKLYRCTSVEVNKARHELFQKTYTRENKIIDLTVTNMSFYTSAPLESLQLCSMPLESLGLSKSRYPYTLPIRLDIRVRNSVA